MDVPDIADNLDEFLANNDRIVLSYYAPECVNCKLLSYYLYNFSKEYSDTNIKFVKCNMNKITGLREKLHINVLPAVFFYRDGKIVCRYVGTLEKTIKTAIETFLIKGQAP